MTRPLSAGWPDPWPDLPGDLTLRISDSNADLASRNAEHRCGSYRAAGWAPVTAEVLEDLAPNRLQEYLAVALDRPLRPWAYPDQWRLPPPDLFPRWERLRAATARRWWTVRYRVRPSRV